MVTKTEDNSKNRRVVRYTGEFFTISFEHDFDDSGYGALYIMAMPHNPRHKSPDSMRRAIGNEVKLTDLDSFMYGLLLGWETGYPLMGDITTFMEDEGFC